MPPTKRDGEESDWNEHLYPHSYRPKVQSQVPPRQPPPDWASWRKKKSPPTSTLNSAYNKVTFNEKSPITKENLCTKYTPFTYKYIILNEKLPIMKQNLRIFFFIIGGVECTTSNVTPQENKNDKDQDIEVYYEPAEDIPNDIMISDPKTISQEEFNKI